MADTDPLAYLLPKGPRVPPSHSFLPLRSGPPIYFPLPAPYDNFCLTGILPGDLDVSPLGTTTTTPADCGTVVKNEGKGDVMGGIEVDGMVDGKEDGVVDEDDEDEDVQEARRRIGVLGEIEGSGGWEYPIIRRIEDVASLLSNTRSIPVIGTFSLRPAMIAPASNGTSASRIWELRNVWIAEGERSKGLATLVITYVLHSWFLRLNIGPSKVVARIKKDDTPSVNLLNRLDFREENQSLRLPVPTDGETEGKQVVLSWNVLAV